MKWYGWTPEQAEDEWDKAVRDVNVKRRKDEYGELTIAKLKTAVHHVGVRVGNKRSIGETKKFNAEDQEAITDAKECSSLNSTLNILLEIMKKQVHDVMCHVLYHIISYTF